MASMRLKIHGTPADANRGMKWDTGTYGKHETQFKIHGTPAEANMGINWDTGTYGKWHVTHGKHQTKNLKFLVH